MSNAGTINAKISLDTTELDEALAKVSQLSLGIRLSALDRALSVQRPSHLAVSPDYIVAQARTFEAYLRGDSAE